MRKATDTKVLRQNKSVQKSSVFKLLHSGKRFQKVFVFADLFMWIRAVVWMEGLTINIKLRVHGRVLSRIHTTHHTYRKKLC